MNKINQRLVVVAISSLFGQAVFAADNSLEDYNPGCYIGAQAGYAVIDDGGVKDYAAYRAPSGNVNTKSNNVGEKVFVGYSLSPFVAFEADGTFYPNKYYKDSDYNNATIFTTKMYSVDVMLKLTLPLEKASKNLVGWNAYTKLGMSWGFANYIIHKEDGSSISINQNSPAFGCGLGAEYKFNDHFSIDLSWSGLLSIKKPYVNDEGTFVYGKTTIYDRGPSSESSYIPSANLFAVGLTYKF